MKTQQLTHLSRLAMLGEPARLTDHAAIRIQQRGIPGSYLSLPLEHPPMPAALRWTRRLAQACAQRASRVFLRPCRYPRRMMARAPSPMSP
jgi:hypothetical protein